MLIDFDPEECQLLHRRNSEFVAGRSSWTAQRRKYSILSIQLLAMTLFCVGLMMFNSKTSSFRFPKPSLAVAFVLFATGTPTLHSLYRYIQHTIVCQRGIMVPGYVLSMEETSVDEFRASKVAYSFTDGSGKERRGVQDGPECPENFAEGMLICVLFIPDSDLYTVL